MVEKDNKEGIKADDDECLVFVENVKATKQACDPRRFNVPTHILYLCVAYLLQSMGERGVNAIYVFSVVGFSHN